MNNKKELFMDGKTYVMTQMRIIEMGKLADSLNLEAFLKCISNAEAALPLAEHEMAKKAAENLTAVKRLAEAAMVIRTVFRETYANALQGHVVGVTGKLPGQR